MCDGVIAVRGAHRRKRKPATIRVRAGNRYQIEVRLGGVETAEFLIHNTAGSIFSIQSADQQHCAKRAGRSLGKLGLNAVAALRQTDIYSLGGENRKRHDERNKKRRGSHDGDYSSL